MNVERVTAALFEKGRYHWLIIVLFSFTWLTAAFNNVAMSFYDYAPTACSAGSAGHSNRTAAVNYTPASNWSATTPPAPGAQTLLPCAAESGRAVASDADSISTIVTEWSLRGERRWMAKLATTLYFAGVMIGGPLMGWLADVFGRKPVLLTCLCAAVPLGLGIYFMPFYEGFLALRFTLGIFVQGITSIGPVNCIEFFPARNKFRVILGFQVVWTTGLMQLALIAFLLPQWRQMQLAVTFVPAVVLAYAWWLPESPRWLAMHKRHAQLRSVMERAARIAGIQLDPAHLAEPESLLDRAPEALAATETGASLVASAPAPPAQRRHTFVDLLRTQQVRKRSLVLFFAWFAVMMSYYSMTLNIRPVHPSRHLSFFFNALAELVALVLNGLAVSRFGRRKPVIVTMISGGIMCTICGLVASNAGSFSDVDAAKRSSSILALFGRAFVAASIHTLFIYASELFPTVIRTTAAGVCGFWMRVGSLLAPQLVLLGHYTWNDLPILVIGGSCCIGGGLIFFLPETMNKVLPDSIAEIEGLHPAKASEKAMTMAAAQN